MPLKPNELLIDDHINNDLIFNPVVDGEVKGMGCVPRDYNVQPDSMFADPSGVPLIPKSEWSDRIKEQERTQSRLSDILLRAGIPSTDQGSFGYCWAFSTTGCVIALRALNNQPHIRLNGFSVAAVIKQGKNEGGWCGLSAQFLSEHGIASFDHWPEKSADYRKHYDDDCKANMALHKVTEDWMDLAKREWDRKLTFEQVASCLLQNVPCALDFNWWGHSVLGCDLVEVERGDFGIRIRNSWTDNWGDKGFSVLRGSKTVPNGAVGIRVTGGSIT